MFFLQDFVIQVLVEYHDEPAGWVAGRMLANRGGASWESRVWEGR